MTSYCDVMKKNQLSYQIQYIISSKFISFAQNLGFFNKILKASYYIITGSSTMTQCHPSWSADFLKISPKFESYFEKLGQLVKLHFYFCAKPKGLETTAEQPFLNKQAFVYLLAKNIQKLFQKKKTIAISANSKLSGLQIIHSKLNH